ncbi:hypothetical protein MTO96_040275, partial [Rhipicephalus appendiculatus]
DSKSSLKEMASQCKQCLKQLIAEGQEKCRTEVQKVMELVDNQDMLQIRGVEEWLTNLDELLDRARKLVQNQQDYLQAFLHNQSSFSPLQGFQRPARPNKLCDNLKERLRWIIYVQKIISEAQVRMMYTIVATRQLRKQLEICRQIHMAPHTYLRAVTEVIRRRHFSHNFLQWAGMLSSQCQQLHHSGSAGSEELQQPVLQALSTRTLSRHGRLASAICDSESQVV